MGNSPEHKSARAAAATTAALTLAAQLQAAELPSPQPGSKPATPAPYEQIVSRNAFDLGATNLPAGHRTPDSGTNTQPAIYDRELRTFLRTAMSELANTNAQLRPPSVILNNAGLRGGLLTDSDFLEHARANFSAAKTEAAPSLTQTNFDAVVAAFTAKAAPAPGVTQDCLKHEGNFITRGWNGFLRTIGL